MQSAAGGEEKKQPWEGSFNWSNPEHIVKLFVPDDGEEELVKGKKFSSKLSIQIGEFEEPKTSVHVSYDGGSKADDFKRELGVTESLILSLSFIVKEGIDAFTLGELSGSVKNILGLGSMLSKIKYQLKSKMSHDSEGAQVYTLSIVSSHEPFADAGKKILEYQSPEKFEAFLELSSSPLEGSTLSTEFVKAKAGIEWSLKRDIFKVLEMVALANGNALKEKDVLTMTFVKSLKNVEMELKFEDLKEFWDKFIKLVQPEGSPVQVLSWSTLGALLVPYMSKIFKEELPAPVLELYKKLDYLKSLHSVHICVDKHLFSINCKHLQLFSLLPPLDTLTEK